MDIEKTEILDNAVVYILQQLRELECDGDELTNSMEENIKYIMMEVFKQVYSSTVADQHLLLGVLAAIKMEWYLSNFYPNK